MASKMQIDLHSGATLATSTNHLYSVRSTSACRHRARESTRTTSKPYKSSPHKDMSKKLGRSPSPASIPPHCWSGSLAIRAEVDRALVKLELSFCAAFIRRTATAKRTLEVGVVQGRSSQVDHGVGFVGKEDAGSIHHSEIDQSLGSFGASSSLASYV